MSLDIGTADIVLKYFRQSQLISGIEITGVYLKVGDASVLKRLGAVITDGEEELFEKSDAIYVVSPAENHAQLVRKALVSGCHVLCESPIAMSQEECEELFSLAQKKKLILMDAIKTAYSQAYARMLLLAKVGKIGEIVSVEATCTSLRETATLWRSKSSMNEWAPTTLLPVFGLLGTGFTDLQFVTMFSKDAPKVDLFTKIELTYPHAVASLKVGQGVKSEGELIISGTRGYIYVPAPWWKTEYFEVRYENPADNRRYFYQLDGEGIHHQLIVFQNAVSGFQNASYISQKCSVGIAKVIDSFCRHKGLTEIKPFIEMEA